MPRSHSRVAVAATVITVLLASLGLTVPASAADSKDEAVHDVLDVMQERDLSRIDSVVCADVRERAREVLDIASEMGIDGDPALLDEYRVVLRDRDVEIVSEDGETATARVTGIVEMSFPEDRVEELVRVVIPDAEDDEELLQQMLPTMTSLLNSTQPVDEEVALVYEDGEWLVCGGFGLDEPAIPGLEPSVSTDGLCALASPEELTALGGLVYDSSSTFDPSYCTYSTSDYENGFSVTVNLVLDDQAEANAGYYGADMPVEVGGTQGFASGGDAFQDYLFVQVGPDYLLLTVSPPERAPEGFDWLAHAIDVAELLAPSVGTYREELAGPPAEPTPEPTPEPLLCDLLPLDSLNLATGLGFDEASGGPTSCSYLQIDGQPGWHTLSFSLSELGLDEYTWMTEAEETTVGDLPALRDPVQLVIGLPGDAWTLQVSGWVDENDDGATLSLDELLEVTANTLLPILEVPEPTDFGAFDTDDGLDTGFEVFEDEPTLPRRMCEYVDLDAVNDLGLLEYAELSDTYADACAIVQPDWEKGSHQLSFSLAFMDMEMLRSILPDASELSVAGDPALLGATELYVETGGGVVMFLAILPQQAADDGLAAADILVPVAEMVVAAIDADLEE